MDKKRISIAIDGPAASGKSTTARLLAKRLGYVYIDTGAMYRAATLAVLQARLDVQDESLVVEHLSSRKIRILPNPDGQHTFLDEKDVTRLLRHPEIDRNISLISSYAGVRNIMLEKQREIARDGGVVMDGRDIGTVVLPDAELKIFLIASIEARAMRRLKDMENSQRGLTLDDIKNEIAARDQFDASRKEAPLRKAHDAIELDTSHLTIEQQVDKVYQLALRRIHA